ncbi:MAG: hypothetical protein AAF939_01730 [Planctomycetota bacterium]
MKFFVVSSFVLLQLIAFCGETSSQELKLHRYCSRDPILVVGSADATNFVESVYNSKFASNEQWSDVTSLLCHPEFGLATLELWDSVEEIWELLISELAPQEMLFSIDAHRNWKLIFETSTESTQEVLVRLVDKLDEFFDSDIELKLKVKENTILEFFDKSVFFCFHDNRVVVSGTKSECERINSAFRDSQIDGHTLDDSRTFHALRNQISKKKVSFDGELTIYIDPMLLKLGLDKLDEQTLRSFHLPAGWLAELSQAELDGIAGVGLSVDILNSQNGQTKIVANSFVKIRQPRSGILDAIRLEPIPLNLPILPGKKGLFTCWNLNYQHMLTEKIELFDKKNGIGAYEKMILNKGFLNKNLGFDLIMNRERSYGNTHGTCWYFDGERYVTSAFSKLKEANKMIQFIKESSLIYEQASPRLGYVMNEIGGFPALERKDKRFGFIFKDEWMISGNGNLLERFSLSNLSSKDSEVDQLASELTKFVAFDNGYSAVVATWRGYWDTLRATSVAGELRRQLKPTLKSHGKEEYAKLYRDQMKNYKSFRLDPPISRAQCRKQIYFLISNMLMDSFSNSIILLGDEELGIRIAAMLD